MKEARNTQVEEIVKHFANPRLVPVDVSPRLWKEHMEHRSVEEQMLCRVLMLSGFIREYGPDAPEQGTIRVMLPSSAHAAWEEHEFWGELTDSSLDFYLPEEVH